MHANEHRLNDLTEKIIGSSYEVANTLGRGFVEKVYANYLHSELLKNGIKSKREWPIKVYYKAVLVGEFFSDLLVEDEVIIETKAVSGLTNLHMAQCLNYLKASERHLCLLINFGSRSVQVKRIVNSF